MSNISWLTAQPIAHRGLHDMNRLCFENTLSAFKAAADKGYAIECDVHLSADGVPVVFHDLTLKRVTGAAGYVWEKSAAALNAMRVGDTDDHIPTLREALDCIAGRVPIIIELKASPGRDDRLVEQVAGVLADFSGKAAIMSFEHRLIRQFKTHAPHIPSGLTAEGTTDEVLESHFSMLAHEISFVSYAVADLPNRFVTFIRDKLALPVITWTVRTDDDAAISYKYADQITFEGFSPASRTSYCTAPLDA